MSKWGIVSVNFDISDETKNFGTRAVAVSNGAVYESVTIATIQTNEEVNNLNCVYFYKIMN